MINAFYLVSISLFCSVIAFKQGIGSRTIGRIHLNEPRSKCLQGLKMFPSELVAIGDFAAEIEKATGPEIYGPIFKAGLFLFLSGIVSAVIASVIVIQSDAWDELDAQFESGEAAQVNRALEKEQKLSMKKAAAVADSKNEEDIKDDSVDESLLNVDL